MRYVFPSEIRQPPNPHLSPCSVVLTAGINVGMRLASDHGRRNDDARPRPYEKLASSYPPYWGRFLLVGSILALSFFLLDSGACFLYVDSFFYDQVVFTMNFYSRTVNRPTKSWMGEKKR